MFWTAIPCLRRSNSLCHKQLQIISSESSQHHPGWQSVDLDSDELLEFAAYQMEQPTLRDHLRQQVPASGLSLAKRSIAYAIIDSLDERGYLAESPDEIADYLEDAVTADEVEIVLEVVQQFDPPGVAARNLSECLVNQLKLSRKPSSLRDTAREILHNHLDSLAEMQVERISEAMQRSTQEISAAIRLIQSLNPTPGSLFGELAQAVVPDVVVRRIEDQWSVELNPFVLPKLKISESYQAMMTKQVKKEERGLSSTQPDRGHCIPRRCQATTRDRAAGRKNRCGAPAAFPRIRRAGDAATDAASGGGHPDAARIDCQSRLCRQIYNDTERNI